jgi:hypothetical protein
MKRTLLALAAVATGMAFSGTGMAEAARPLSFHCSGLGFFSPTNIGTPRGGTAGIIIGDGSGVSQYTAFGENFTVGGELVGSGDNYHEGEVVSFTSGIVKKGRGEVHWPGSSGDIHVLSSDDGEVHFKYVGSFVLDLEAYAAGEPSFGANAVFIIVGGTGRFEDAHGVCWIDVAVPVPLPPVTPGVPLDIPFPVPFLYNFDGFIILDR